MSHHPTLCLLAVSERPQVLRCLRCGRSITTAHPPERVRLICKSKNKAPQPQGGAGTELKQILGWFSQLSSTSCQCNARAVVMDREGADWCAANQGVIVGWLMEEWDKRELKLADFLPAHMQRFMPRLLSKARERTVAERGAAWAVRRAVKRAKARQTAEEPK